MRAHGSRYLDAVIIAGGEAPAALQSVAGAAPGNRKALLPIAGRSLLQRALDACAASRSVERIIVAGIGSDAGLAAPAETLFLDDAGSLVGNIVAGARTIRARRDAGAQFFVISCDIPCLSGEMLDWLCAQASDPTRDFHYTAIRRETMEARFPGAGRTYYRVRDGRYCSGDAHVFSLRMLDRLDELFNQAVARRKSPIQLARLFGPVFLLRFALGRSTHDDICRVVEKRLGIRGTVIVSPYAEIGMDVDAPRHARTVLAALHGAESGRPPQDNTPSVRPTS